MLIALPVAAGLLLGAAAPRFRAQVLIGFAALLALAGSVVLAATSPVTIQAGALGLCGALLFAALLGRLLPRLVLFLLLNLAFAGNLPLGTVPIGQRALVAVGLASLAVTLWLAIKADLGIRVACALLGATLIVRPLAPPHPQIAILVAAAVLFAGSAVLRRRDPVLPPRASRVALFGVILGLAGAGCVLAAFNQARPIPPRPAPFAARLARLALAYPQGGLVWPLPSEAIGWSDDVRGEFAWLPNLDAAWLGAEGRGLWKLPNSTLAGRLVLARELIAARTIKDAAELDALRAAARASVAAVREALPLFKAGTPEARIADAIRASHLRHGCTGESFPPIAASGPSAATPHGSGNRGTLQAGQLVVLDVGCLVRGYASDFTRTIPVGGRFTDRQRKLYEAVYAGQQAAAAACRPGVPLSGRRNPKSLDSIARAEIKRRGFDDHNSFGIGHSVGLFVHDPVAPGPLKAGMVITIEPGIYIEGELGIRIEDTFLVTEKGCEQLTVGFPAELESVQTSAR